LLCFIFFSLPAPLFSSYFILFFFFILCCVQRAQRVQNAPQRA